MWRRGRRSRALKTEPYWVGGGGWRHTWSAMPLAPMNELMNTVRTAAYCSILRSLLAPAGRKVWPIKQYPTAPTTAPTSKQALF